MPPSESKEITQAEKKVASVLDELEAETHSDVSRIALEDVVDTNPVTGRPEVLKAVDIQVQPRSTRNWSRTT
ncbi:hypothetical protein [Simplicispira suum]|uniref:Uncharacterized protein n=1 Tax=Simplicispira suum TaxID=2109915 RepID=A0A2S0MVR7_9BURK|nr:hypothetical protein [Simplicispira suum]AVO39990.1 hypothetical protein C6571_00555 [Simplicispira suum]MBW7834960.1 hypothetical protein [Simplicispira suum]